MTIRITETHLTLASALSHRLLASRLDVVSVEDPAAPDHAIALQFDGDPYPYQFTDEEATALADCLHQLVADRVDAAIRANVQAARSDRR